MLVHKLYAAALFAAATLLSAPLALSSQTNQQVAGSTVVTILPEGNELPGGIPQDALHLKLNGKEAAITRFAPLRGPQSKVELVVLIDDGARASLGSQLSDVAKFLTSQRPDTKVAVAYMENGRAVFEGPLTADHNAVANQLHLPLAGEPGISASPYFCLSDLAKNWPSNDENARREVVMITDGIDYYNVRYDPEDPYILAAINDAVRARLIVYSIYWRSADRFDQTNYAADDGQNLLAQVSDATGGLSYWEGTGNPVSLVPYFDDIDRRLDNQYELAFMTAAGNKPEMQTVKLTVSAHAKVDAPQQVYVHSGTQ